MGNSQQDYGENCESRIVKALSIYFNLHLVVFTAQELELIETYKKY